MITGNESPVQLKGKGKAVKGHILQNFTFLCVVGVVVWIDLCFVSKKNFSLQGKNEERNCCCCLLFHKAGSKA